MNAETYTTKEDSWQLNFQQGELQDVMAITSTACKDIGLGKSQGKERRLDTWKVQLDGELHPTYVA